MSRASSSASSSLGAVASQRPRLGRFWSRFSEFSPVLIRFLVHDSSTTHKRRKKLTTTGATERDAVDDDDCDDDDDDGQADAGARSHGARAMCATVRGDDASGDARRGTRPGGGGDDGGVARGGVVCVLSGVRGGCDGGGDEWRDFAVCGCGGYFRARVVGVFRKAWKRESRAREREQDKSRPK